jgi:alkylation response protein AidB-like acyl-CoA dehydrogenase
MTLTGPGPSTVPTSTGVDALVDAAAVLGRRLSGAPVADRWAIAGVAGLLGLSAPVADGGSALDPVQAVTVLEAFGSTCESAGTWFAIGAHLWACLGPIDRFGREEQRQRWMPGLIAGRLVGGLAMTEPDAGSDSNAIRTRATRTPDGWRLDGAKAFVTNAPEADVLVVFARTGRPGFAGISAFVVPVPAAGLTVGPAYATTGLVDATLADVTFDGCVVPADAILAGEGGGAAVFAWCMRHERALLLAPALGAMRRSLDDARRHAAERHQFGAAIASFPPVADRLVRMHERLVLARLAVVRAAQHLGDATADLHASMAKITASEACVANALDAIENLGGYGFATGRAEQDLRDALGSRAFSGTNDVNRSLLAKQGLRW